MINNPLHLTLILLIIQLISCTESNLKNGENEELTKVDVEKVKEVLENTNPELYNDHGDYDKEWEYYLKKEHPDVETMKKMFKAASERYAIPQAILESIAMSPNNWTQIGPSIDKAWGVMSLYDSEVCQSLNEAAKLLSVPVDSLKEEAKWNIQGAAALLSQIKNNYPEVSDLDSWHPILAEYACQTTQQLSDMRAEQYINNIKEQKSSTTIRGETYSISKFENL